MLFASLLWLSLANSGDSLTLQNVQKQVQSKFPLQQQKELIRNSSELKLKNIRTARYPSLGVDGQLTYQSDVIKIDLPIPHFSLPEQRRDHYLIAGDVQQVIFDGGAIHGQIQAETAQQLSDRQQVEVELNKLKTQVNQLYFSILLLKEKEKIIYSIGEQLDARAKALASAVRNGVQNESVLSALQAEILKTGQQLDEVRSDRTSAIKMLSELMGSPLDTGIHFTVPGDATLNSGQAGERPEYSLFDLQKKRVDASEGLLKSKRYPRLVAFGQAGWAYPLPFNPFGTSLQSFYIVGLKLNWNLWDWNSTQRELQQIKLAKSMVDVQQQVFDKNLRLQFKKDSSDWDKNNAILSKDKEIMQLRARVLKTSASQLENGVITSADYIADLNAEAQARLNYEIHLLQLKQTQVDLLTQMGKL